jgi:GTP-binding protein
MISEITITAEGGKGGNGSVSFRRERYEPRGGPDGGDGGAGGSVRLRAEDSWRGLEDLRGRRHVTAGAGQNGAGKRKHGKRGEDELVLVPVGTRVWRANGDGWEVAGDLVQDGQEMTIAAGGSGGSGNARFATSTNQAPRIAERGLPGEKWTVRLELRLLADVGLVGLPNAGKSSLLRAMTSAEARVSDHAFTTLEPQLGVVEVGFERFVMADIPGLVEGASEGRGLGTDFLRQIERTSVLLIVLDGTRDDPVQDLRVLKDELKAYGEGLAERHRIVAVNKQDVISDERIAELLNAVRAHGCPAFVVSAKTGKGRGELATALLEIVKATRSEPQPQPAAPVQQRDASLRVERLGETYRLVGEPAEREAARLGVGSGEARKELWRRLKRMGAATALRRAGARPGDTISVGDGELELPE